MKQRKSNRKRSALRWLAALLAVAVLAVAAEVYTFTPGQALRRMARELDLGEMELLEVMDGEPFYGVLGLHPKQAYILQNESVSCFAFGSYQWPFGWSYYFPEMIEHGEQASVPVDLFTDAVELEGEERSVLLRRYIFGLVLNPEVETVEVRIADYTWENDVVVWETKSVVSIPRDEWEDGPHYDYFFYMFEPMDAGYDTQVRALDRNGVPITWTNLDGEAVEWYGMNWPRDFYEDGWNHLNGERK